MPPTPISPLSPQSMMVFTGMAVLGVILAALMFRFSTRRPPELREVK
ncbi:hypothetical protein [Bifidobacterium breve]|nr:hypothetical protein [Bifidobacterium breve]